MNKPVGIIGSGSFGMTLAHLASENTNVLIYTRRDEVANAINQDHSLKGYTLSANIKASTDLEYICSQCQLLIPVIPSTEFRNVIKQMAPFLNPQHFLIHGTKGLDYPSLEDLKDRNTLKKEEVHTMSEVIRQETGLIRIGCIAGPNLSKEIMDNKPAATVIASPFNEVINLGVEALKSHKFYPFSSLELKGTELVSAFKNIFAIVAGVVEGADFGKNVFGLLITRAMREMIIFLNLMDSSKNPALGTAGLGDLVATSASGDSRNFSFGKKLSQGLSLEEIMKNQTELAEGVRTLKAAYLLSKEYKVDAPITHMLHQVVYEGMDFNRALGFMMSYPFSEDVDYM